MTDVVGLLPMGGKGSRLGAPAAPKPLLPTITDWGLVPLYQHALRRILEVTSTVYSLIHTSSCVCALDVGLPVLVTDEAELAGAFGEAGRQIFAEHGDVWVAMAFPDSIWHTHRSFRDVLEAVRSDGALALFDASAAELDTVHLVDDRVDSIETKRSDATGEIRGWDAWIVRAGALATFTGDEKDGPQLGRLDLGWAYLGRVVDLGTPERYIANHDQRGRDHGLQPARA